MWVGWQQRPCQHELEDAELDEPLRDQGALTSREPAQEDGLRAGKRKQRFGQVEWVQRFLVNSLGRLRKERRKDGLGAAGKED
jgi:hypothetical protein